MNRLLLGAMCLFSTCLAQGAGEDLYKQGTAVYKTDPKAAFGLFVQAAEAGNVSAMTGTGHCYETGMGTTIDYTNAIGWYKKALKQNSLKACEGLVRIYASCYEPKFHDGEKAVKYATLIVRKKPNNYAALALLAAAHARNIDFKLAVTTQRRALRNVPLNLSKKCKMQLQKYINGEPCPARATEVWILQATNINNSWAQVKLAYLAGDPNGTLYNPELALDLCQKKIDEGMFDLYVQKGNIYFETGDLDKAYDCYQAASEKKIRTDETLFRDALKLPADNAFSKGRKRETGYTYTSNNLITYNEATEISTYKTTTHEVPPNISRALYYYKIAQKKGHSGASKKVTSIEYKLNAYKRILENKKGLTDKAIAKKIHLEALRHIQGIDYPRDLKLAETLYKKSYTLNPLGTTAYDLVLLYLNKKLESSTFQTIQWLERAHASGVEDATKKLIELYSCSLDETAWNGEKALQYAIILTKKYPDDYHTHQLLACAYARNKQFSLAERSINKAADLLNENTSDKLRKKRTFQSQKTKHEQQCHSFKRGEPWTQ